MNLVFEDDDFPLWLIADKPVNDEQFLSLREANPMLQIEREPNGELHVRIKSKVG